MKNNRIGLLLSIAIGDCYGSTFEFKDKIFRNKYNDLKYYNHDGTESLIGIYTDDTALSIAIAAHMIDKMPMTHLAYIDLFKFIYNSEKRNGYSKRTTSILEINNSLEFSSSLEPRNSNGCVMRCLPLGLYSTPSLVKKACLMQATTTHPLVESILATQCIALLAHYFYHGIKNLTAEEFLKEQLGAINYYDILYSWKDGEVSMDATKTASFVLQKMNNIFNHKLSELLKYCIDIGGDTDSTAALCMGLASLEGNYINDLPDHLINNLENNRNGKDYLIELDKKLIKVFPKNITN